VPAESPYKNLAEFLAWMKANPAKANLGMPAAGSLPHFFGLMIGREAKIDIGLCPFKAVRLCSQRWLAINWPVALPYWESSWS
jgi:tripartite-type tricarboxylate transporter receptor subunit TctC